MFKRSLTNFVQHRFTVQHIFFITNKLPYKRIYLNLITSNQSIYSCFRKNNGLKTIETNVEDSL